MTEKDLQALDKALEICRQMQRDLAMHPLQYLLEIERELRSK